MDKSIFNADFFTRNPKLGYQFKVEFEIHGYEDDYKRFNYYHDDYVPRVLSTCVESVTIPSIKSKNTPYVSNILYNVVEYDYSDMSLKIVFAENDDMIVNKLLMHLMSNQRPNVKSSNNSNGRNFLVNSYMNVMYRLEDGDMELGDFLDIFVYEMNPNKNNNLNYDASLVHVFKNCYIIKSENVNMEYTENPKGVTMEIEFGFLQYYIAQPGTNIIMYEAADFLEQMDIEDKEYINTELEYMAIKNSGAEDFTKRMYDAGQGNGTIPTNVSMEQWWEIHGLKLDDINKFFARSEFFKQNVEERMQKDASEYGKDSRYNAKYSTGDFSSILHNKVRIIIGDKTTEYKDVINAWNEVRDNPEAIVQLQNDTKVRFVDLLDGNLDEDTKRYMTHVMAKKSDMKPEFETYYKWDKNGKDGTSGVGDLLTNDVFDKSKLKGKSSEEISNAQKEIFAGNDYAYNNLIGLVLNVSYLDKDVKDRPNEIAYELDLGTFDNSNFGKDGNYYENAGAWLDLGQSDIKSIDEVKIAAHQESYGIDFIDEGYYNVQLRVRDKDGNTHSTQIVIPKKEIEARREQINQMKMTKGK